MEENHVFISYASLDDEPLPLSQKGWVSQFDDALRIFLTKNIGKKARIWRAPGMARNAEFDKEIFDNLLQSSTLVSVVTPSYFNSEYCLRELQRFVDEKPSIGAQSRVFKVHRTHVEIDDVKRVFPAINGYFFYTFDEQTKLFEEFDPEYDGPYKIKFFLKVSDLAQEIARLLKTIEKVPEPAPLPGRPPIYLAHTAAAFEGEYDNIRRDLQDRGYRVMPPSEAVPPTTTEEYKAFVRENMRDCTLSIHLIGKNYGECPEDGEQSYIHLQVLAAADRKSDPGFSSIVWLPKDVNINQPRHVEFVTQIWASTEHGVEVLEKPLEELKTNILDALERPPRPAVESRPSGAKPSVLVLFDKTDAESAVAIETHIKESGFSVWSAGKYLSGDPSKLLEAQNEYLRNCDAVLIYWNNSPDFWARIMLQRLQKILGDGREEPFVGEAMFVAGANSAADLDDDSDAEFLTTLAGLDTFLDGVKTAFRQELDKRGQQ